ncbi:J domain-containing protein [Aspergillus puulaauensis]|uniref:J domain-containing protein n=1 Tax=Aspergillus puulaauensis TaxID=1220207 RepID=A0A7R7XJK7_9EURO|nr:uncharacterized protein APUU_30667S [Aspergillus puulaauensis]BCS22442.1 hypothetical protein APUU_30667S [Aspergillus puulaauensis]
MSSVPGWSELRRRQPAHLSIGASPLTPCIQGTPGEVHTPSPLETCGMLRKSKIITYNGLLQLGQSYPAPQPQSYAHHTSRLYATAHSDFSERDISWPSTPSFTPYDIFGITRGAPYSKHRFYELAKVYHPDRPCNGHPLCKDISPEVRLQRYRIVVTAHEILSDPNRRAAYDRTGMGWSFNPVATHRHTPTGSPDSDPIFSNATWEDWERWYNRNEQKQETVVDHSTFVTFVVLLFFMGAAVQASWITQVSTGYEDRLRDLNEQSTRFLNERRSNTVNQMAGSDAKVQHFLIRRDPSGYGLKEEEQPVYHNVLKQRNDSSSEESSAEKDGQPKEGGAGQAR